MDSLVWAKMRYCSYWPARVVETPPELGPTLKNKTCVLFLGTKEFGFVPRDKIENYMENRERFAKKGKGSDFRTAVQHMDEYVSDSVKFFSHVYVEPKKNEIKIKTERDIEQQLGIKVERPNEPNGNSVTSSTQITAVDSWAKDKKSLIDNIMALKSENQLLVQNLNDKDAQLNSANQCKHEFEIDLEKKDLEFSAMITELNRELHNAVKKEAESTKSISNLKRENSLLKSQNKQMQAGLVQTEKSDSDSDQTDYYEVETLLDDKLISERHYLVRWNGFDSTHDSWERESNLNCASILKNYKQLKKKKLRTN